MPYTQAASTLTPALIIYLIDVSDSMNGTCGNTVKLDLVHATLQATLKDMVRRSMRNGQVLARYHLAMIAYHHEAVDMLGGIQPLPAVLARGLPKLKATDISDTAAGFAAAEILLHENLVTYDLSPAPLVCHLTDGMFTTTDPVTVVRRIQRMKVQDGPVLVENIYIAEGSLKKEPANWSEWQGVQRSQDLNDDYARYLHSISSLMPETYRNNINAYGYTLKPGSAMFFPGTSAELVRLAFAVSAATQFK